MTFKLIHHYILMNVGHSLGLLQIQLKFVFFPEAFSKLSFPYFSQNFHSPHSQYLRQGGLSELKSSFYHRNPGQEAGGRSRWKSPGGIQDMMCWVLLIA